MWGSYGFQVLSFLILTRLNGCFWLSFVLNGSFFFVFHDMFLFIYYYCYYYLFLWFGFTSMWFNTLVLEIWINQKKKKKEKKKEKKRKKALGLSQVRILWFWSFEFPNFNCVKWVFLAKHCEEDFCCFGSQVPTIKSTFFNVVLVTLFKCCENTCRWKSVVKIRVVKICIILFK